PEVQTGTCRNLFRPRVSHARGNRTSLRGRGEPARGDCRVAGARGAGTCHGSDQVRNRRAALEPVLRSAGASRTLGRDLDRRGSRGEPGHRLLRRHGDIERRKGCGEPLELDCDLQRGGDRTSRSSEAGPRTASQAIGRARAGHPRAAVLINRRNEPQRRKRRWLSSLLLFLGVLRVSATGNAPRSLPFVLARPAFWSLDHNKHPRNRYLAREERLKRAACTRDLDLAATPAWCSRTRELIQLPGFPLPIGRKT